MQPNAGISAIIVCFVSRSAIVEMNVGIGLNLREELCVNPEDRSLGDADRAWSVRPVSLAASQDL